MTDQEIIKLLQHRVKSLEFAARAAKEALIAIEGRFRIPAEAGEFITQEYQDTLEKARIARKLLLGLDL